MFIPIQMRKEKQRLQKRRLFVQLWQTFQEILLFLKWKKILKVKSIKFNSIFFLSQISKIKKGFNYNFGTCIFLDYIYSKVVFLLFLFKYFFFLICLISKLDLYIDIFNCWIYFWIHSPHSILSTKTKQETKENLN